MLEGCVPWPDEVAQQYRQAGVWEGITVAEMVARAARNHPDRTAVIHGDRRTTYRELVHGAQALADGLLGLGLEPLDRAVVQLPNVPEFVTTYLALNADRRHSGHGAARASPRRGPALRPRLGRRRLCHPRRRRQFRLPPDGGRDGGRVSVAAHMHRRRESRRPARSRWTSLLSGRRQPIPSRTGNGHSRRPTRSSTMLLSGGTTSLSKLIPRTHDDYVLNARLCAQAAGFDARHRVHGGAAARPQLQPGIAGHARRLLRGRHAGHRDGHRHPTICLRPVERERVTVIAAAVPLISNWLNSEVPRALRLVSLKVVQNGGARLPPELRARLRQRVRLHAAGDLRHRRGPDQHDAARRCRRRAAGQLRRAGERPRRDQGRSDDAGAEVPDGEAGRIGRRAGPYTIRGYYNAPEKNAEASLPTASTGWATSCASVAATCYTEGRRKDLINRGGEKISCDEIENLIFGLPQVR